MSRRLAMVLSLALISALTLAAAYIHIYVGGVLLLINAAGAIVLLGAFAATHFVLRRTRALVLIALAAYSAGSIGGWAIMGPYFDLAYVTKSIELALIVVIGAELWRTRSEIRPALRWLLSIAAALPVVGSGVASRVPAANPASGEE